MDSGKKLDEEEAQETQIKQGNKETTKYLAHSAVGEMQKWQNNQSELYFPYIFAPAHAFIYIVLYIIKTSSVGCKLVLASRI